MESVSDQQLINTAAPLISRGEDDPHCFYRAHRLLVHVSDVDEKVARMFFDIGFGLYHSSLKMKRIHESRVCFQRSQLGGHPMGKLYEVMTYIQEFPDLGHYQRFVVSSLISLEDQFNEAKFLLADIYLRLGTTRSTHRAMIQLFKELNADGYQPAQFYLAQQCFNMSRKARKLWEKLMTPLLMQGYPEAEDQVHALSQNPEHQYYTVAHFVLLKVRLRKHSTHLIEEMEESYEILRSRCHLGLEQLKLLKINLDELKAITLPSPPSPK